MLIFVTGGVRSGKSSFAEKLAIERSKTRHIHYVATSLPSDNVMRERILRHQARRNESAFQWTTWEVGADIEHLHRRVTDHHVMLLDCLTTLVNQTLFHFDGDNYTLLNASERCRLFHTLLNELDCLQHNRTLIVVSNEIFYDMASFSHSSTFVYAEILGKLHQAIVKKANEVYLCENGIPLRMK